MKRVLVVMLAVVSLTGCGRQRVSDETRATDAPTELAVEVDNRSMTVSWHRHQGRLISGYYVYISEEPLAAYRNEAVLPESVQPFNRIPFAGDTNPEDGVEQFVAEGLENLKRRMEGA